MREVLALGTKGRLKWKPMMASSSLHFLFPSFFLRESFLKKINTIKLQAALPLTFEIIMEPWSHSFLHSVSHIVKTKKVSYMDTDNVPGGQLITQHQCHFCYIVLCITAEEPGHTFLRNLPLYVWTLESAPQRHCLKSGSQSTPS